MGHFDPLCQIEMDFKPFQRICFLGIALGLSTFGHCESESERIFQIGHELEVTPRLEIWTPQKRLNPLQIDPFQKNLNFFSESSLPHTGDHFDIWCSYTETATPWRYMSKMVFKNSCSVRFSIIN